MLDEDDFKFVQICVAAWGPFGTVRWLDKGVWYVKGEGEVDIDRMREILLKVAKGLEMKSIIDKLDPVSIILSCHDYAILDLLKVVKRWGLEPPVVERPIA